MKKVAIVQSSYIPWKGFFDMVNYVDELVLYDDVQYTVRDWRNRNKIKTAKGLHWLSIPVKVKGKRDQKIKDVEICEDTPWTKKHWNTLQHSYRRAPFFEQYRDYFENLYNRCNNKYLSEVNYEFIKGICEILEINTKITWSMDYQLIGDKTSRLVEICKQAQATKYVSGPKAKNYLDEECFKRESIEVEYMDYSGYPEYSQLYPPFRHDVSILDLIFHEGSKAKNHLKSS